MKYSTFLCKERCKSLGPLKLLLPYAPHLSEFLTVKLRLKLKKVENITRSIRYYLNKIL